MNSHHTIDCPTKNFADSYQVIKLLAEGENGTLWLVERIFDKTLHVAKLIRDSKDLRKTWCHDRLEEIPDEILLSETLDHPNIIDLHEIYFTGNCWVIVMEYSPDFVDLSDFITQNGALSVYDAREVLTQLLDTCLYLTSLNIDHRDIKDSNILFNPTTRRIKLIDFGSASFITPVYTTCLGTEIYLPPEYFKFGQCSAVPAMIWSIGTLAYVLLNGDRPFSSKRQIVEYKELEFLNPLIDEECKEFLCDLLTVEEGGRMTLEDLTMHPWMDWLFMN
jgi:serine/threonine protein kinase